MLVHELIVSDFYCILFSEILVMKVVCHSLDLVKVSERDWDIILLQEMEVKLLKWKKFSSF